MKHLLRFSSLLLLSLLVVLTACDSGGGMDSEPEPDPEPGDIEATVEGSVTDAESGDPISGADVSVLRVDADEQLGQATTGDEGSYELSFTVPEDDTPDQLAIEAKAEGFMAKTDTVGFDRSLSQDIALDTFETTESTASGIVTRADTDDPIEGATVTGSAGDNDLFEVSTGKNGQYEATFEVRATDEPDQITVEADDGDFNATEQTVDFTSEITADLSLDPSQVEVVVDGTVLAEQDESSVEGAEVRVFRPSGDEPLTEATSSSGGTYELSFNILAPDAPDSLRLEAEERRFSGANVEVEFASSVTQDIELPSIEISTLDELQAIQTDSAFPLDGYYVQTADIDASETASQNGGRGFQPIGDDLVPFSGVYDGNGFAIEALTVARPDESPVGMFGKVTSDGQLQNISLKDVEVEGNGTTGALVGNNEGEIQNTSTTGNVIGVSEDLAYELGGLVGLNIGNVRDSETDVSVTIRTVNGINLVGGLVGDNEGTVQDSKADGNIEASSNVGGLVGYNDRGAEIRNSVATGNVEGARSIGGLVGGGLGDIQGSTSNGNVEGGENVGGLAGDISEGSIEASMATGSVTGDLRVGGLVGESDDAEIQSSEATGDVEGNRDVGGLVGDNRGLVQESIATGDVSGSNLVGGLVGANNEGEVHLSLSEGVVAGQSQVGGLVGGNIIRTDGGIGDPKDPVVNSSYARSDVSGDEQVGALVGANTDNGSVGNSYAVGSVSGKEDTGGLIGVNGANVSGSYWDTEATGQNDGTGRGSPDGTTGLSTDEMQGESAKENMDSFDFMDSWQVVAGDYPALSWEDI